MDDNSKHHIKVALAQFEPKPLEVETNFQTAADHIQSAASRGCNVVILPEFHLTSWLPAHPNFKDACRRSESYLSGYQELAKSMGINIVPGTLCHSTQCEASSGQKIETVHNTAYFIAAKTGEICGSYHKKNLWHTERSDLTKGADAHFAFETPLNHPDGRPVRAGLLICWDLAFPEAFRALVRDAADIVFIPSFWFPADAGTQGLTLNPDSEKVFLHAAVTTRAFENVLAVVFCNAGGFSCVGLPFLGLQGQCSHGDVLKVVDIDLGVLRAAEENYKIRQDLAADEWHYS